MVTDSIPLRSVELFNASERDAMTAGPAWVIDGLIQEGVNLLYGPPKSGKTFVALDIAMHIALGEPVWHGRRVEGGPVVYVAAEDGLGASLRRNAWRTYHKVAPRSDDWRVVSAEQPVYLHDASAVSSFIAQVREMAPSPALIVFDTLARCVPGVEENENGAMGLVVDHLERIRHETGARAVLVVHHTGKSKDGAGEPRGASSISAAMQGVLKLTGKPAGEVTLTVKSQRNGVEGEEVHLGLQSAGGTMVVTRGNEKLWRPQAQTAKAKRITRDRVEAVLKSARKALPREEVVSRLGATNAKAVQNHLTGLVKDGLAMHDEVGYSYVR